MPPSEFILISRAPSSVSPPFRLATRVSKSTAALVTVRIEEEVPAVAPAEKFVADDPAFGIRRDREDMADVAAYVRKIRQPRYNRDGSRNEP